MASKWKKLNVFEIWVPKWIHEKKDPSIYILTSFYRQKRGCKKDWNESDWPPKKVRITVEVVTDGK